MKRLFSLSTLALVPLAALAVFTLISPRNSATAQEPSETEGAADASAAWDELRATLQRKLRSSTDLEETFQEALGDLEQFALEHKGSEEAVIAWLNRGDLAANLGREDLAKESLQQAAELATDPRMIQVIAMLQNQLEIRPGRKPPQFSATTLSGAKVTSDQLSGNVTLLDFWATWCAPCIAELPNLKKLYEEHRDEGFEIVSISIDPKKAALTDFLDRRELPWRHVWDPSLPDDSRIANAFGVSTIPFVVLIGRDGRIIDVDLHGKALEKAVRKAVAGPPDGESPDDDSGGAESTEN